MNKLLSIIIIFFLLIPLIQSDENIKVRVIGYGKSLDEVHIQIYNTGNTNLKDIEVFVDGSKYKEINTLVPPGKSIQDILFLDFNTKHTIEVKSSGFSHSIQTPTKQEKTTIPEFFKKVSIDTKIMGAIILITSVKDETYQHK